MPFSSPASGRIGFAGSPDFAAAILSSLLKHGYQPQLVLTQPDRPAGRGKQLTAPAVKQVALAAGLRLAQPPSLKQAIGQQAVVDASLDLLIVAAYGLILPKAVLTAPRRGCVNVHASLLPRWRGAAPVERAIMAGDPRTGVCLMAMEEGLDTGAVYSTSTLSIGAEESGVELEARLAIAGGELLLRDLPALLAGALAPTPQSNAGVTYAQKLTVADGTLDFRRDAKSLARQIRALRGRMSVAAVLAAAGTEASERVLFLRAHAAAVSSAAAGEIIACERTGIHIACGDGTLVLTELRLTRGKGQPMSAATALNGFAQLFRPGRRFDVVR